MTTTSAKKTYSDVLMGYSEKIKNSTEKKIENIKDERLIKSEIERHNRLMKKIKEWHTLSKKMSKTENSKKEKENS